MFKIEGVRREDIELLWKIYQDKVNECYKKYSK